MSQSVEERLAVVDASPHIPLQSLRDLVVEIAQKELGTVPSQARAAEQEFVDPSTLPEQPIFLTGDQDIDSAVQHLASLTSYRSVDELRALLHVGEYSSTERLWLAVVLASHCVDEELKVIFNELQQGRKHLNDWDWVARDLLGNVLGPELPARTRNWLAAIAASHESAGAASLASALLESIDASPLDPPLSPGHGDSFVSPMPSARRRASRVALRIRREGLFTTRSLIENAWLASVLESWLRAAVITALFRLASRGRSMVDRYLADATVRWVRDHQAGFYPDLDGLFREYWHSVRELEGPRGSYNWYERSAYGLFYRRQVAWTISRGGVPGLASGLAAHLRSTKPTERRAAALLIADAADYLVQPDPPRFEEQDESSLYEVLNKALGRSVATLGYPRDFRPPPPRLMIQRLINDVDDAGLGDERLRTDAGLGAYLYSVSYATNRELIDPDNPSRGFTSKRDPSREVHYGTCEVQIPKAHSFGSTRTALYRRVLKLHFSDDHLKVVGRTEIHPSEFVTG